ncbi:MAG TPA: hypothetical protein VIB48_01390 [Acidimicrobiia bacterium]
MQPDGPPREALSTGDGAADTTPTSGTGARLVAATRVALGTVLLAGSGLGRLLDGAAAVGAPDGTTGGAPPTDGAARPPSGALTTVARTAAGAVARVPTTIVAVTPVIVRAPVSRRVAAWRAAGAAERERSQAVAAATLVNAMTLMTDVIVDRFDVGHVVEQLPLDDIIASLELTDIIVSSTETVTGRVLDVARSRAADADTLVDRILAPLRRRGAQRRVPPDGAAIVPAAPG